MDNFFQECPAMMSDGRIFTDYRSPARREQYNKTINGFVRDDDYRMFLQLNAEKIMDSTWDHSKKINSCFPNQCIHTFPTRSTPGMNYQELKLYNAVRSGQKQAKCENLADYRMTITGSKQ